MNTFSTEAVVCISRKIPLCIFLFMKVIFFQLSQINHHLVAIVFMVAPVIL